MTNKFCITNPLIRKRWSPSSLSDLGQCARKFQLRSNQGWRQVGPEIKKEGGRYLHAGLAKFDTLLLEAAKDPVADPYSIGHLARLVRYALDGAIEFMFGEMGVYGPDEELVCVSCGVISPAATDHEGRHTEGCGFGTNMEGVWHPWETGDTKINRWTLIRTLIDYADSLGAGNVQPKPLPGTPATEVQWEFPLDIISPDGDPYILTGFFDGPVSAGVETFIRERKVTFGSVSKWYFDLYSLGPQVDTYDIAGKKLWPEENISGVMLEVIQIGVQFSRVQRRLLPRTPAQREEWLGELETWIMEAEVLALQYGDDPWPMRRSNCNLFGGCEFRGICDKDPSSRERFLKAGFTREERDG